MDFVRGTSSCHDVKLFFVHGICISELLDSTNINYLQVDSKKMFFFCFFSFEHGSNTVCSFERNIFSFATLIGLVTI